MIPTLSLPEPMSTATYVLVLVNMGEAGNVIGDPVSMRGGVSERGQMSDQETLITSPQSDGVTTCLQKAAGQNWPHRGQTFTKWREGN